MRYPRLLLILVEVCTASCQLFQRFRNDANAKVKKMSLDDVNGYVIYGRAYWMCPIYDVRGIGAAVT